MNVNSNNEIINCKISINKLMYDNRLVKLAIDENNTIIKYSNEHFYLLKKISEYNNIINEIYEKLINCNEYIIIKEEVVNFITIFSTGTAHGYAGLFNILDNYLKKYNNHNILVYKNSQKGILDIIKKIINNDKIIYIEPEYVYKFDKIYFIENYHHDFNPTYALHIDYIINDYIIDKNYNIFYDKICIIKSNISSNITQNGIISQNEIELYCKNNNFISIEPTKYNEIEFINILHNCKEMVVSWGTAFFKNYHYLSEKCTKITVLVFSYNYICEYNYHKLNNTLIFKYKNSIIEYIIIYDICKYLNSYNELYSLRTKIIYLKMKNVLKSK